METHEEEPELSGPIGPEVGETGSQYPEELPAYAGNDAVAVHYVGTSDIHIIAVAGETYRFSKGETRDVSPEVATALLQEPIFQPA